VKNLFDRVQEVKIYEKINEIFEFDYKNIYFFDDFFLVVFLRSVSDGSDVVVDFFDDFRV
jgi:hypothetical protein